MNFPIFTINTTIINQPSNFTIIPINLEYIQDLDLAKNCINPIENRQISTEKG